MRTIVIIGSGAGGTMVAQNLRKELPEEEFRIVIIDKEESHHYQAGYLFIPFGVYGRQDVLKPKKEFIPQGVEFVLDTVTRIDTANRRVETLLGSYEYDWLVVATGCRIKPDEVEGLPEIWQKGAFDFYTLEGAQRLRKELKYFDSGKIVLNIAEVPYKCPIAPLEFIFLADAYFRGAGVRDKVEIELVTPLDGFFTKPVAAEALKQVAEQKRIGLVPHFNIASVDAGSKVIESHDGKRVGYDLLVSIPPNFGDAAILNSELGDPMGYVETDKHTMKAKGLDRVYVIGDASNVPASKAGSSAHYQSSSVVENIVREIDGQEPRPSYDGHATCFLASGHEKAILLDFNYEVEPLPGMFPFPGIGPFSLLKESLANFWGKMMFRWVYWNLMMQGDELPLEPQMNTAGKVRKNAA